MPNCNWFGTREDHAALLDQIYDRGGIELYELQSGDNLNIRKFATTAAVLAKLDAAPPNASGCIRLDFNIRVLAASPHLDVHRSDGPKGSWFESTGSMGFVRLTLNIARKDTLDYSATNTLTPARMGATNGIFTDHTGVDWDMNETTRYSSWLNRTIRKAGMAKIRAIAVHPGALAHWDAGRTLWQANKATQPDVLIRT